MTNLYDMTGALIVILVLVAIGLAVMVCYFAYKWREAEKVVATQRDLMAQFLAGQAGIAGDQPPNGRPPRPIRIARDGAAGLAVVALATGGWLTDHIHGLAITGAILAVSTAVLLMLAPPAHTPVHQRQQGVHATRKPRSSKRATGPSLPLGSPPPSALAGPATSLAPIEVGLVAATGALSGTLEPPRTPSDTVPATTTPVPSLTTTVPPTSGEQCVVEVELLKVIKVCIG